MIEIGKKTPNPVSLAHCFLAIMVMLIGWEEGSVQQKPSVCRAADYGSCYFYCLGCNGLKFDQVSLSSRGSKSFHASCS